MIGGHDWGAQAQLVPLLDALADPKVRALALLIITTTTTTTSTIIINLSPSPPPLS